VRHAKNFRKFSRSSSHRRALFRNMVTSLLRDEKCLTTVEKAKDLRPIAEKMISLGRVDSLHARRKAYGYIFDKAVVHKLFAEIGPRFKERNGGYTRIIKGGRRHGDAAELAWIELV
jgi:large subunit ribosomal protein L17